MKISKNEYQKIVHQKSKKSHLLKNMLSAFLVGGIICTLGQCLQNLYEYWGFESVKASAFTSITLIFLASFLTGIKLFDNIAKHAGAGTLVPITGFSNAITSPAMEFKNEGMILGVGAKIFTIAGPVITYGTVASVIYGIIYWIITMLK